jgi:hypothetical protein
MAAVRAKVVLLFVLIGVIALIHVQWESINGRHMWLIDGHPVDVWGALSNTATRLTRQCQAVRHLQPSDSEYSQALDAIRSDSPPDSDSARFRQLLMVKHWMVAQVEFDRLLEAILVLKSDGSVVSLLPHAMWSGDTAPFNPESTIREYLRAQAPEAPAELLNCFDLQPSRSTP